MSGVGSGAFLVRCQTLANSGSPVGSLMFWLSTSPLALLFRGFGALAQPNKLIASSFRQCIVNIFPPSTLSSGIDSIGVMELSLDLTFSLAGIC